MELYFSAEKPRKKESTHSINYFRTISIIIRNPWKTVGIKLDECTNI